MTGMRLSRCTRSISEAPPRGTMMSIIPLMLSIMPTASRSRVGTSWIAASGRPAVRSPSLQRRDECARGMEALRAAAQDRRVARLERQAARIGGHVGPALVDDADDAERHAIRARCRARWAASNGRARCRPDRAARRCPRAPWRRLRAASGRARDGRSAPRRCHLLWPRRHPRHWRRGFRSAGCAPLSRQRAAPRSSSRPRRAPAPPPPRAPCAELGHRRGEARGFRLFADQRVGAHDISVTTRSSRWMISSRPR